MLPRLATIVGALSVLVGTAHAADGKWLEIARSSKLGVGFEVQTDSAGNWCAASPKVRMVLDAPEQIDDAAVQAMWTKAMAFLKQKQCAEMTSVAAAEVIADDKVLATVTSDVNSKWAFKYAAAAAPTQVVKAEAPATPAPTAPASVPKEASEPAPEPTTAAAGSILPAFSSPTWTHVQEVGLAAALAEYDVSSKVSPGPFYGDWKGIVSCPSEKTRLYGEPQDITMSIYNASNPQAIQITQWYVRNDRFNRTESTAYVDGDRLVTTRAGDDAILKNMVYRAQASDGVPALTVEYDAREKCDIRFVRTDEQPTTYIKNQQRLALAENIKAELAVAPWRGSDFGKMVSGDLTATCESVLAWAKTYPADHRTPLGGGSVLRHFSDADIVKATGWNAYEWSNSDYAKRNPNAMLVWVDRAKCRKVMSKGDYKLLKEVALDGKGWRQIAARVKVDAAVTSVLPTVLSLDFLPDALAAVAKSYHDRPDRVLRLSDANEMDVEQLKLLATQIRTIMLTDMALNIASSVNNGSSIEDLRAAEKKLAVIDLPDADKAGPVDEVRQHIVAYGNGLLTSEFDKLAALSPVMESLSEANAIRDAANKIAAEYLSADDAALVAASYAEFFSGLETAVFTAVESNLSAWETTVIEPGKTQERIATVQTWQDRLAQLAEAGGDEAKLTTLNTRLDAAKKTAGIQAANEEVASIVVHYDAARASLSGGDVPTAFDEIAFVDRKIEEMNAVGALDAIDTLKAARRDFWTANVDAVADGLFAALTKADAEGDEKTSMAYERGIVVLEKMIADNGDDAVSKQFASKKAVKASEFGAAAITAALAHFGGSLESPVDISLINRELSHNNRDAKRPWSRDAVANEWKSKRLDYMEAAIAKMDIEAVTGHYFEVTPIAAAKTKAASMMFLDRTRFSKLSGAELLRQGLGRELSGWEAEYTMADNPGALARVKATREKLDGKVSAFALEVLDDAEDDIEDMSDKGIAKWRSEFASIIAAEQSKAMDNVKAMVGSNQFAQSMADSLKANDNEIAVAGEAYATRFMRINAAGGLVPDTTKWTDLSRDQKKISDLVLAWTKAEAARVQKWRCKKTRDFADADRDLLEAPLLGDTAHTVQSIACEMDNGVLMVNAIVELPDNGVEVQTQADNGDFWKFRFRVVEVTKGQFAAFIYEYASPFEAYEVNKVDWNILRAMLSRGLFDKEALDQMAAMKLDPSNGYRAEDTPLRQGVQELWDAIVTRKDVRVVN